MKLISTYLSHPIENLTFYSSYKGLYYIFIEGNPSKQLVPIWILSDKIKDDGTGRVFVFDANDYRIDQCFDMAFKMLENEKALESLIGFRSKLYENMLDEMGIPAGLTGDVSPYTRDQS